MIDWETEYSSSSLKNKNTYPNEDLISFIYNNYQMNNNCKVLDLGCGWGNNLKFLKDFGFDVYGVELSPSAFKKCKEITKNVFNKSFDDLSVFKDDFFELIVDRQSIQHNDEDNIYETIYEVHRCLKTNGIFYSHMISKANYSFKTNYVSISQLNKLFQKFKIIKNTFVQRTDLIENINNIEYFIIEAKK